MAGIKERIRPEHVVAMARGYTQSRVRGIEVVAGGEVTDVVVDLTRAH